MRQTWKGINELIGSCKKKNKSNPINFIRSNPNEVPTSDPREISDILNRCFATVGSKHYVPRRVLLSIYNSLIVPYITYGVCAWGNCALTFQRKIVNLQKRALRLIYFSKSKEHAVPFFLKSNCLPLPSLFFRDCSYLLYDINRQTATVNLDRW